MLKVGTHLDRLKTVYDSYGVNSPEFYKQVEKFIVFLQLRYMGTVDEDCMSECFLRLVDSLSYYDETQCNIGTWVFSTVRNKISSFLYGKKKDRKGSPDPLPFLSFQDRSLEAFEEEDSNSGALLTLERIKPLFDTRELARELMDPDVRGGIKTFVMWEKQSCQKSRQKERRVTSLL